MFEIVTDYFSLLYSDNIKLFPLERTRPLFKILNKLFSLCPLLVVFETILLCCSKSEPNCKT